jgi:hypothetical protein
VFFSMLRWKRDRTRDEVVQVAVGIGEEALGDAQVPATVRE